MAAKTVLYPIEVTDTKYCWDHTTTSWICEHFDNGGGYPHCDIHLGSPTSTHEGFLKPEKCLKLRNAYKNTIKEDRDAHL